MTPEQLAILRDAVEEFDPESDNPNSLLIGTGLAPYDLAMEILSRAEVYGVAA